MNIKIFPGSLFFLICLLFSPVPAAAQEVAINLDLARQYFSEAEAVCNLDGGKLWGVSLCGPMIFVDPATRMVVANRMDEEEFLRKKGDVFVGLLPAEQNIANTAVEWAGVR